MISGNLLPASLNYLNTLFLFLQSLKFWVNNKKTSLTGHKILSLTILLLPSETPKLANAKQFMQKHLFIFPHYIHTFVIILLSVIVVIPVVCKKNSNRLNPVEQHLFFHTYTGCLSVLATEQILHTGVSDKKSNQE